MMFVNLNPFNLSGPEFLLLYAICLGVVSAITIAWRLLQWFARAESEAAGSKPLDLWELAYLRGRDLAVAQTAVVDLSSANLIETDKANMKLLATTNQPNQQLSPVPFAIHRAAQSSDGVDAAKLTKEIAFECERIRDQLIERGYLKSWFDRFWEVWPGRIGFVLLMLIGAFRVGLGIYRDKPVGYLILLLVLTFLLKLALTYSRPITARGRRALNDSISDLERYRKKVPRSTAVEPLGISNGEPVPALPTWAFAVMGMATAQSMLDPGIAELIRNRTALDGSSGSGCSANSCGGGGDGGGGGGCGGGGCGGCGS